MNDKKPYDKRVEYDKRHSLKQKSIKLTIEMWDRIEKLKKEHGMPRIKIMQLGIEEAELKAGEK